MKSFEIRAINSWIAAIQKLFLQNPSWPALHFCVGSQLVRVFATTLVQKDLLASLEAPWLCFSADLSSLSSGFLWQKLKIQWFLIIFENEVPQTPMVYVRCCQVMFIIYHQLSHLKGRTNWPKGSQSSGRSLLAVSHLASLLQERIGNRMMHWSTTFMLNLYVMYDINVHHLKIHTTSVCVCVLYIPCMSISYIYIYYVAFIIGEKVILEKSTMLMKGWW